MINKIDLISLITLAAGASSYAASLGLGPAIDNVAPGWGTKVLAWLGIISIVATMALRILASAKNNPTPTNTVTVIDQVTGRPTTLASINPPGTTTAPTPATTPKGSP